jgi:hypothetical protein
MYSCILFWMGYNGTRGRKLSQSHRTHFLSSLSELTYTPKCTPSLRNKQFLLQLQFPQVAPSINDSNIHTRSRNHWISTLPTMGTCIQ